METEKFLAEFKDLDRLEQLHRMPRVPKKEMKCSEDDFATLLEEIYDSSECQEMPRKLDLTKFPIFSLNELKNAMKFMRNRRCADREGISLEEIKYGPEELHVEVLKLFNMMIQSGRTEESWRKIMFHMIAKSGDLTLATNYRPIAILPMLYRVFSRMFYWRLRDKLDTAQSDDQAGFRAGIRIEDALGTVES